MPLALNDVMRYDVGAQGIALVDHERSLTTVAVAEVRAGAQP